MSAWARQRQFIVIMYTVLFFLFIATVGYFVFVYNPPSCFDGVRNGLEEGTDCGGGCQLVCPFKANSPNITWARAFEIGPGLYNFGAQIENPNFSVGANVDYVFRGYSEENILISEIFGTTSLFPSQRKIIFEPSVETGQRRIARVFVEFVGESNWYKLGELTKHMTFRSYELEDATTSPKLRAEIYNTNIRAVSNITVVAVLYDTDENIYQVSQTFVERVEPGTAGQAFFTWRNPFENEIQNVEFFITEPQE